jgi:hypothetical protein
MENMSFVLEVARLAHTARHFTEKLFVYLGAEGMVSADALANSLPLIF